MILSYCHYEGRMGKNSTNMKDIVLYRNVKNLKSEVGEMFQWIKSLLYKNENLSLEPK